MHYISKAIIHENVAHIIGVTMQANSADKRPRHTGTQRQFVVIYRVQTLCLRGKPGVGIHGGSVPLAIVVLQLFSNRDVSGSD